MTGGDYLPPLGRRSAPSAPHAPHPRAAGAAHGGKAEDDGDLLRRRSRGDTGVRVRVALVSGGGCRVRHRWRGHTRHFGGHLRAPQSPRETGLRAADRRCGLRSRRRGAAPLAEHEPGAAGRRGGRREMGGAGAPRRDVHLLVPLLGALAVGALGSVRGTGRFRPRWRDVRRRGALPAAGRGRLQRYLQRSRLPSRRPSRTSAAGMPHRSSARACRRSTPIRRKPSRPR